MALITGKRGEFNGYPRGKITTLWGREGGGKSTLAAHFIAEAQKIGPVLLVDTEYKLDSDYLATIGVSVADAEFVDDATKLKDFQSLAKNFNRGLILAQPMCGEQAGEWLEAAVRSGKFAAVVCDSVAGMIPKAVLDGEVGESNPGLHARLISQVIAKIKMPANANNCGVLFTTQRRALFGGQSFAGSSYEIVGGNALKYYTALLLQVAFIQQVKDGEEIVGIKSKVSVEKNIGMTRQACEVELNHGRGIDKYRELLDFPDGAIINAGNGRYKYANADGELINLAHGRANAAEELRNNPALFSSLRAATIARKHGENHES